MKDLRYYETIACKLLDADPDKLSSKDRSPNLVMARNLCIYYRNKKLNFGQSSSTKRYGQSRTNLYHIIRIVNDEYDINKTFKILFDIFIKECEAYMDNANKEITLTGKHAFDVYQHMNAIIKNFVYLESKIYDYLNNPDFDETLMIEYIDPVLKSIDELKKFFNYDDHKGNMGSN